MDLFAITSPAVSVVNPQVPMIIKVSTGYTQSDDGTQIPAYAPDQNVMAEVQPLSSDDLRQLDGLNLQGVHQAIYLRGQISGIIRTDHKGGDLVVDPRTGKTWLVDIVLESWPDWCKVAVTLQNNGT